MSKSKVMICPYCGDTQPATERCRACGGHMDALSRQATHNQMGPWFIRDPQRPFQPGCSYETIVRLIQRNVVTKNTVVRGPTTKQFWNVAKRTPGIAHILGYCHNCSATVEPTDHGCHACGVPFGAWLNRDHLGVPAIRPLPDEIGFTEPQAPMLDQPDMSPRTVEETADKADAFMPDEGGAISSFVPDDELLATSSAPVAPPMPPLTPGGGIQSAYTPPQPIPVAATVTSAPSPASVERGADLATHPMMRSMQRRLAQQQRTNRMLLIAVLCLAVVAVILLIAKWSGTPPTNDDAGPGIRNMMQDDAGDAPDIAVDASSSAPDVSRDTPELEDAGDDVAPEATDVANDAQREYAQAQDLMREADDTSRTLDARLVSINRALEILRAMQAAYASTDLPDDFDATLEAAQTTFDDLQLDRYFAEPE
jgi:hypothetical protein